MAWRSLPVRRPVRDRSLGRERQPDLLIAPVGVKVEYAAVIKRHDVATQHLVLAGAVGLDQRLLGFQRLGKSFILPTGCRIADAFGDVGDRDELICLDRRALELVCFVFRIEAVCVVVLRRGREVLDTAAHAVVIGLYETVRRDEGRRASVCQSH